MKLLERLKVTSEVEILYAKTTLKNILKTREVIEKSFLIFTLMELSTNLIKHAGGGEVWILESMEEILISALDYGEGIENLEWAMQNGTTQMKNSLGVGLYQMQKNENYNLEIFSILDRGFHGTVALVAPKSHTPEVVSLGLPHATQIVSGDIFAKKGRFLLLADGVGHGKKALSTVEFIKSNFYKHPFSCMLVDEFFMGIDKTLREREMRGSVLSLFEIGKKGIQVCGIGNISFWQQFGKEYRYHSQKDGILGEYYSKSDKIHFKSMPNQKLIAATDGIDPNKLSEILKHFSNESTASLLALVAMHFTSIQYDDKTVIIITQKEKE